ncbi:DoxX family protein [Roseococcus sp.]|uniref:DoxX family protein n=1 Tax=Roseococcus sp. TaxID=2109646 RepID=UPI003BAB2566
MSLDAWSPRVLSVLRFVSGLLFLMHGTQKYFSIPTRANPGPELLSQMGVGGMIEMIGGALIMIGLFTRPAAFICSGMMAIAYFQFHAPNNIFPILNRGETAILFSFVFFYLTFAGPGPWSLDAKKK